jgi:ATP-binding cassette subfamily C protein
MTGAANSMPSGQSFATSELGIVLRKFRGAMWLIVLLCVMLNVLALSGSIYLMLIYDKVLQSGSLQTLASVFVILIVVYAFTMSFDTTRAKLLQVIGEGFDQSIAGRLQSLETDLTLKGKLGSLPSTPMNDLDQIRSFLSSQGPAAIIDLPWIVFFLAVLYMLHPMLALTTLIGAIVLGFMTWFNDRQTRTGIESANRERVQRNVAADRTRRSLEAIKGLAITGRMDGMVTEAHSRFVNAQAGLSRVVAKYTALSRGLRMFIQSAVLTVGAILVIEGEASGGIIFASSILSGRALAPVDQAIANWRGFIGARQAWRRISALLGENPAAEDPTVTLGAPHRNLGIEGLSVTPPGSQTAVVHEVSFALAAGDAVAVVGPSGSGKSSLSRAIVNVWSPSQGTVRLDGAPLDQYHEHLLTSAVGYLPQDVELFTGTVAQNIARFEPDPSSEKVIAAAKAAGIHDFVLNLPNGYDSPVGQGGAVLSGGQRQRVALARALYGDPFLLVLDEPDSNLDPAGEAALAAAIAGVRKRGGMVLVVTHRMALVKEVNLILVLREGKLQAFGPRDTVLAALNRANTPAETNGNGQVRRAAPQQKGA